MFSSAFGTKTGWWARIERAHVTHDLTRFNEDDPFCKLVDGCETNFQMRTRCHEKFPFQFKNKNTKFMSPNEMSCREGETPN